MDSKDLAHDYEIVCQKIQELANSIKQSRENVTEEMEKIAELNEERGIHMLILSDMETRELKIKRGEIINTTSLRKEIKNE